jgi:uncharacterized protein (TIRG00374 family)
VYFRTFARVGFSLALTAVFIWLALRNVDLAAVGDALGSAQYGYLVPAALCTVASFALRTVRWGRILDPVRRVSFRRLFPVLMLGFAANNVLPARIGEVARAYALGSREGVSRGYALATIAVERVCDGVTLLVFMTIALALFPLPVESATLDTVIYSAIAIFSVATVVLISVVLWPLRWLSITQRIVRRLPERLGRLVLGIAEAVLEGLSGLRSRRALLQIAGYSVVIWSLECAVFACVLRAFALGLSTGEWLAAAVFLLVFVNLGIMIPSLPGYIGTYQFFAKLALGAFSVPASLALGLSLVAHAMQYGLITGMGLLCLWRMGLSPRGLGALLPTRAPASAPALSESAD